jgi:putative tryptophan/tyrosine transport system substrate-binding protein
VLVNPGNITTADATLRGMQDYAHRSGLPIDMLKASTSGEIDAALTDPRPDFSDELSNEMLAAAHALGRDAIILEPRSGSDIDAAFATLVKRGARALVVGPYVLFINNGKKIIELAAHHNIPATYAGQSFVVAGGLMSYSVAGRQLYRLITSQYVAPILRGTKPADLPVQQPTKFELVINLKTAKALGLTVPETLLATADEVIQ